ncbi:BA75_03600T0 [Komagataella pastoris]|uniref:BA75_03600T0 n=1 Tax=Komagataella pastoris TaxID=4922 RepID=A0A1B2JFV5_PICPA|nr:BA75_03600T0 [Komagataella pastoris]
MSTLADDLDDGLEYAYNSSDNEVDEGVVVSEPEDETTNGKGKRKRDQGSSKEKLKEKKKIKMQYDIEHKLNFSKEQPDVIVEELAKKIRQHNKDLSSLELSELYFSKDDFVYTGDYPHKRNLPGFSKFLKTTFPRVFGKSRRNTSKYVLVLSQSAIRCCDIHRATRDLPGSSLKLIKKNKMKNDIELIKRAKSHLLSSTTGRLTRLLEEEECTLTPDSISAIVVDSSYLDSKKISYWDDYKNIEVIKNLLKENKLLKVYLY